MRRQILYGRRFVPVGEIKAAMTAYQADNSKENAYVPQASFRGVRQIASLDL
jgi:hypothetical protein